MRPPRLMGVYLLGYGIGRFWVEALRIDATSHVAGLRWNQWVALVVIIGSLVYLVVSGRSDRGASESVVPESGPLDEGEYVPTDEPVDER